MTDEVIIGVDPHKASNTIAVLARDETLLTRRRFANSDDGFVEMLAAVAEFPDRVWAVEGANGVGRSIAQRLVGFDETVVRRAGEVGDAGAGVLDRARHQDRQC